MHVTVSDVLNLPVVHRARPEVITGDPATVVRWVHTSEIFEIGSLLEGGELLLTTGLGLVREPENRLAAYVEILADRRVAGLFLELGRTFTHVPEVMVDTARKTGLLLGVLHEVVPWVHVTEAAHRLLMGHELTEIHRLAAMNRDLLAGVARGSEVSQILEVVAHEVAAPVGFFGRDDSEVWSNGTIDPPRGPFVTRTVRTSAGIVGEIRVARVAEPESAHLDAAASAVAALLASTTSTASGRALGLRSRLNDVIRCSPNLGTVHRRTLSELELAPSQAGATYAYLVITPDGTAPELLSESVCQRYFLNAVAVETTFGVVLLAKGPLNQRATAEDIALGIARDLRREIAGSIVVEGEAQRTLADLGRELYDLQLLAVNPSLRRSGHVLISQRETTLLRLLAHVDDVGSIERFVAHELAPVLAHDADNRPALMPTLIALLGTESKAAAAASLGVTRQTVHHRSQVLEGMLDIGPAAPLSRRAAASLAALLWQWRTSGTL